MLSFAKLLPKQLGLINVCSSYLFKNGGQRFIYSPAYCGIDGFNKASKGIQMEHGNNTELVKNVLKQAIDKPETKVFTEDLRIFLHLSKSDADIDLLVNAIGKFKNQEKSALSFNFEAPLMRLLYVLNKTDKALQLYFDQEHNIIDNLVTPTLILITKLVEEKRYADVLKVFNNWADKYKLRSAEKQQGTPHALVKAVAESLLLKNDAEALKEAKEFKQKLADSKLELSDTSLNCLTMLALEQNDLDFANQLISLIQVKHEIKNNFKILALLQSKQPEEALKVAIELLQSPDQRAFGNKSTEPKKFFITPIKNLKEAIANSNNLENIKKVDELLSKINQNNLLFQLDLKEFLTKLVMPKTRNDGGGNFYGNRPQQQQRFGGRDNQQQQQRFGGRDNQQQQQPQQRFGNYQNRFGQGGQGVQGDQQQQQQQPRYNNQNRGNYNNKQQQNKQYNENENN